MIATTFDDKNWPIVIVTPFLQLASTIQNKNKIKVNYLDGLNRQEKTTELTPEYSWKD